MSPTLDPKNTNPSRMGPNVMLFIIKDSMQINISNCLRTYCIILHINMWMIVKLRHTCIFYCSRKFLCSPYCSLCSSAVLMVRLLVVNKCLGSRYKICADLKSGLLYLILDGCSVHHCWQIN